MIYARFLTVTFAFCIVVCHGEDDVDAPRYQALSRIIRAAHTTDLPEVDRVEVFALSIEDPFESEGQDRALTGSKKTFLVRPAEPREPGSVVVAASEILAIPHDSKSITGDSAKRVAEAWRALEFQPNGTFCHIPAYGIRFFRGKDLLFSVSVCWKCQNFYAPTIDPQTGRATVHLLGFKGNAAAKKLLNELRRIVPHPQIRYPRLK